MRRLVLFLDGTWNNDRAGDTATNIVRLRKMVEQANRESGSATEQRIYYDEGVGTRNALDRALGGAFGIGLSENVRQAYRFMSQFYQGDGQGTGSEIYIFGFSRGAYTARSVAGFVAASGLLKRENCSEENMEAVWAYYRTPPKKRLPAEKVRLEMLCHPTVRVHFLGVFDTVGSLGIPTGMVRNRIGQLFGALEEFHDTKLGSAIDFAFHAVAIDEHRGPFVPTLWAKPDHNNNRVVQQVWFPGVHSDIGGGYKRDDDTKLKLTPICDLSLLWMYSRVKANTALSISPPGELQDAPGNPHDSLGLFIASRTRPMYRLIDSTDLKTEPGRSFDTFKLQPPDESYREFVHVSAIELMAASGNGRPAAYRPANLVSVIPELKAGKLKAVGYDGHELSTDEVEFILQKIGS